MGKKRGVRAEIIAGSPDSASKSCKRSREEKKKARDVTTGRVAQHPHCTQTRTLQGLVGCRRRTNCNCSAESVKPEIWGRGGEGRGGGGG